MSKKKILFINSVCGFGSTGRIVVDLANNKNFETKIIYGRNKNITDYKNAVKFNNYLDTLLSMVKTIVLNNNLNLCKNSTIKLIDEIKKFNPDLIHLHNLHGYYINIELLFDFLSEYNKPVVWTFHDCWPYTGYCCYYDNINCNNFENGCLNCKHGFSYPFSIFKQNIKSEYIKKKELFTRIKNLTIITPSTWLKKEVCKSFFKDNKIEVINNGIVLPHFENKTKKANKIKVLAVANIWTIEKGIKELVGIVNELDNDIEITVVGKMSMKYRNILKKRCTLIKRTNNKDELNKLYYSHDVFINPTLQDNFPTVNIESISCGTPIITYNTGGSVEVINNETGIVIKKRDKHSFAKEINNLKNNYSFVSKNIMEFSKIYSKDKMLEKYNKLYLDLIEGR